MYVVVIANTAHASAPKAIVGTLTVCSCQSVASTPIRFWFILHSPQLIHVLKVAKIFVMVNFTMRYFWINFSDSESSWAELNSLDCCAVSLSDVIEGFSTHFKVIDP